jgi:hypothetical protein
MDALPAPEDRTLWVQTGSGDVRPWVVLPNARFLDIKVIGKSCRCLRNKVQAKLARCRRLGMGRLVGGMETLRIIEHVRRGRCLIGQCQLVLLLDHSA